MTIRRTMLIGAALTLVCLAAMAADYPGPTLQGTATLRSGETISGVVLTAQLGIVDGAEIGSRLPDGGYFGVMSSGNERDVKATDIASVGVDWANTGTEAAPKWKITKLTITTKSGETIVGEPTWLVHATSLIIEQADGTQKKVYAFPLASSNFSPDNLLARLTLGGAAAPATGTTGTGAITPMPPVTETTTGPTTEPTTTPATTPATGTTTEVVTIEPATPTTEPTTTPTTPATGTGTETTPTVTVSGPPIVTAVPEGAVFAVGQPAVIVFEVINPETGKLMKIRFLLVPLPAE